MRATCPVHLVLLDLFTVVFIYKHCKCARINVLSIEKLFIFRRVLVCLAYQISFVRKICELVRVNKIVCTVI
jgi:hypothetical protein